MGEATGHQREDHTQPQQQQATGERGIPPGDLQGQLLGEAQLATLPLLGEIEGIFEVGGTFDLPEQVAPAFTLKGEPPRRGDRAGLRFKPASQQGAERLRRVARQGLSLHKAGGRGEQHLAGCDPQGGGTFQHREVKAGKEQRAATRGGLVERDPVFDPQSPGQADLLGNRRGNENARVIARDLGRRNGRSIVEEADQILHARCELPRDGPRGPAGRQFKLESIVVETDTPARQVDHDVDPGESAGGLARGQPGRRGEFGSRRGGRRDPDGLAHGGEPGGNQLHGRLGGHARQPPDRGLGS